MNYINFFGTKIKQLSEQNNEGLRWMRDVCNRPSFYGIIVSGEDWQDKQAKQIEVITNELNQRGVK